MMRIPPAHGNFYLRLVKFTLLSFTIIVFSPGVRDSGLQGI